MISVQVATGLWDGVCGRGWIRRQHAVHLKKIKSEEFKFDEKQPYFTIYVLHLFLFYISFNTCLWIKFQLVDILKINFFFGFHAINVFSWIQHISDHDQFLKREIVQSLPKFQIVYLFHPRKTFTSFRDTNLMPVINMFAPWQFIELK